MNDLMPMQSNQKIQVQDFNRVRISIASPDKIRRWSNGEIKKPETINYRTFKPENDGLFCGRIFGPTKDYECLCGKYKRPKYKGIVCEKCGVEVTVSKVRRERMGHIELASPVAHIWFLKSAPTRIGTLANMPLKDLENVLYFERFIITDPGISNFEQNKLLTESEYLEAQIKFGETGFTAMIGAEALKHILSKMDIEKELQICRDELPKTNSETKKKKIIKRLKVLEGFSKSKARPEWMILDVVPVIPPDLRPLAQLDGGRFATSDLNNLYRRLINRNNRLRRFIELRAPDIIIRNEKRMLQEAVDALFDNGRRGNAILGNNKRPLKSLSDMLKGKQGRFRQNLLGKRVDYSGRSVIVVGPELKLHQCGLPKKMALELFKPFVCGQLERKGFASTLKIAKKIVEKERPEVWDILEEVIREHPVMLNRAPTLHRLGIQAFEPVLIEGKAIQLHPLVCAAFNADFDGDQMAVHVPLSLEAQLESRVLMMSTNNILSPASGKPIIVPSQDIVLGLYYLTLERLENLGEPIQLDSEEMLESAMQHGDIILVAKKGKRTSVTGQASKLFKDWQNNKLTAHRVPLIATQSELTHALDSGSLNLHSPIKAVYETVDADGNFIKTRVLTTAGRMILSEVLPKHHKIDFDLINCVMTKREIAELINTVYLHCGQKDTIIFSDRMMGVGFSWACKAGISFGKDDLIVPEAKAILVDGAKNQVKQFEQQYMDGLITYGEKYNKVVDAWGTCSDKVSEEMMKSMIADTSKGVNAVYMMAHSGARGSEAQIKQLAGMRGLMARPSGEIIETPIISNFKEGLSVLEYFNSTHGARKGLADTALKTANSGYLTRRLVDVAQDAIIHEEDCRTDKHLLMQPVMEGVDIVSPISERILGRTSAQDIMHPKSNELITSKGEQIDEVMSMKIEDAMINAVKIRSPLTCESAFGICASCYGRDLARGTPVNIGEAVGIIAAESIGEPGTQLTMRTFHVGGAAQRRAEQSSIESTIDGKIQIENLSVVRNSDGVDIVMGRNVEAILYDNQNIERARHRIPYGAKIFAHDKDVISKGKEIASWDPYTIPIISEREGIAHYVDLAEGETMRDVVDETTGLSYKTVVEWKQAAGAEDKKPRITLRDSSGNILTLINGMEARYYMSVGAILSIGNEDEIRAGDVLARIPRESGKTRDITGGLPRVVDLFEARKPKEATIIADQDGVVAYGKDYKNKRQILIRPTDGGDNSEFMVPKGKHIIVQEGDFVKRGDMLLDGDQVSHDILEVQGVEALARYLIWEVQSVYRLQGVKISDKHIEVILRQMLQKVEITDGGDTIMFPGEQFSRTEVESTNKQMFEESKKEAQFKPILQGITRAALQTNSFISAASFQETTKVLTDAAVSGKSDYLQGLKENVIVGRLVPAGTGSVINRLRKIAEARDKEVLDKRQAEVDAAEAEEAEALAMSEVLTEEFPQAE